MKTSYPKLSRDSLLTAQRIAAEIWQEKYADQKEYEIAKLTLNNNQSLEDESAMFFFWQQFDPENQRIFSNKISQLDNISVRNQLRDWIIAWRVDSAMLPEDY